MTEDDDSTLPPIPARGRLVAVVGPSGVGKDSIMTGLVARAPDLLLVRRVITRDPDKGGEVFTAVTPDQFRTMQNDGAFCLSWQAHGLSYGIPIAVRAQLAVGQDAIVNLSRSVLGVARATFGRVTVLSLIASSETLAARLADRGRETNREMSDRMARTVPPLSLGLDQITIRNDGLLEDAVDAAYAALYPESA